MLDPFSQGGVKNPKSSQRQVQWVMPRFSPPEGASIFFFSGKDTPMAGPCKKVEFPHELSLPNDSQYKHPDVVY